MYLSLRPLLASLLILGGCALALAAPVSPSEKAQVEALSQRGVAAYRAGRHAEAIAYFQKAYALYPEPKLLYNLGRAHEKLGDADSAMIFYEQALSDPATPAAVRAKSEARLAVMMNIEGAPSAAPPSAAPASVAAPASSAAPTSVAAPSVAAPPSAVRVIPPAAPPSVTTRAVPVEDPSAVRAGAGWTLVALGGTAVVIGGVAYAAGVSDHQALEDAKVDGAGALTRARALELREDGSDRKTVGVTLLAIGGGALIAAIAVFASGSDAAPTGVQVGPRGFGFGGQF